MLLVTVDHVFCNGGKKKKITQCSYKNDCSVGKPKVAQNVLRLKPPSLIHPRFPSVCTLNGCLGQTLCVDCVWASTCSWGKHRAKPMRHCVLFDCQICLVCHCSPTGRPWRSKPQKDSLQAFVFRVSEYFPCPTYLCGASLRDRLEQKTFRNVINTMEPKQDRNNKSAVFLSCSTSSSQLWPYPSYMRNIYFFFLVKRLTTPWKKTSRSSEGLLHG